MGDSYTRDQIRLNYLLGYLEGLASALSICGEQADGLVSGIRDTIYTVSMSVAPEVDTKPFEQ